MHVWQYGITQRNHIGHNSIARDDTRINLSHLWQRQDEQQRVQSLQLQHGGVVLPWLHNRRRRGQLQLRQDCRVTKQAAQGVDGVLEDVRLVYG